MQKSQPNQNPMMQVMQLANNLKNSNNPMDLLQNMAQNNPQLQQVVGAINNSGGNPKQAFMNLAGQMGVDPNQVLNQIPNNFK